VGRWIGCEVAEALEARQVEVILPAPRTGTPCTAVYFDPLYRGGYGWVFPKGATANVGVGVSRAMGGDPRAALAHLLVQLGLGKDAIVGHTGGYVPSSGQVRRLRTGNVLLVGDAAGHTHPVTGAGVAPAVIGGTLAGQAAALAVRSGDLAALDGYEREWASTMGGPMRHALAVRRELDRHWSDDPEALSARLRETWIAFRGYGRRRQPVQ
jgi:flavin-dependent dehydrogenase